MLIPGRKVVVGVRKEAPGVDCLTKSPLEAQGQLYAVLSVTSTVGENKVLCRGRGLSFPGKPLAEVRSSNNAVYALFTFPISRSRARVTKTPRSPPVAAEEHRLQ